MNSRRQGAVTAFAIATALLQGCGGGGAGGGTTGPKPVAVVRITSPASASFGALERSLQFRAEARDAAGSAISGKTITWSTSNPAVATVTDAGLVSSAGNGTAQILAAADGVQSAPVTVSVSQATASVTVAPATVTLAATGATAQLTAAALDTTGHAIAGKTASWSVADASVATIGTDGLLTAVASGTTQAAGSIDGTIGTASVTVAIAATSLTLSPASRTFTRIHDSVQVTGVARDANNNPVAGAAITYTSRNPAVATVDANGKILSVADGVTYVVGTTAGSGRDSVAVTVNAVAASVVPVPAVLVFGALGSARQLAAIVRDSAGTAIPGRLVNWSRVGPGQFAAVSGTGLVTSVAVGIGDTAVASAAGPAGPIVAKVPVTVTQVVDTVTVSAFSLLPDTLKTTGSTRQLTAAAADSNANAIPGATFTWSSTNSGVVTVDATGLETAGSDGTAEITATAGNGKAGTHAVVVRRVALAFTLLPSGTQSISTAGGTLGFTGTAQDSSGAALPINWLSRNPAVATVSPAVGTATTATARGNGSAYIVMSAGTRLDSTALLVSNQSATSADVDVGDNFFRSLSNASQPAVDTVAVGGTVTWTWVGSGTHSVQSTGASHFTSSAIQSSGSYSFRFTTAGTYTYDCAVHGSAMTGRVVVR